MAEGPEDPGFDAVVLAAGRGPGDPLARAHGVSHKCLLPVAGKPMLARVVETLRDSGFRRIVVSIESRALIETALGSAAATVEHAPSRDTAAASAQAALAAAPSFRRSLVTTGDHPLLTPDMLRHFLDAAVRSGADLNVGLAPAETILDAYPEAKRTFLAFAGDRVSGCNLFALHNDRALAAIEHWRHVESNRKRPWRLVSSFGIVPLMAYFAGRLSLEAAFRAASRRLGIEIGPVLMPFADAAVDVDKPEDLELAEKVLRSR
ncbi:MAG TPA: NTP transferase domain-containing protein [Aestuariivirgaceae bacterium]|nr:NTP transferase domain-containing protein [Aestuariivirgaceae bacterium]